MSRKDVGSRRLDLQAALASTARALPRLWLGAGGALLLCAAVWLAPPFATLPGWSEPVWVFGAGLVAVIAVGGLARVSIADDLRSARTLGLGPGGLQFGWPEARLIGAGLLCLIFLAMMMVVLALVVLAIFGTAELDVAAIQARDWNRVGPPWKLALLAAVGIGAVLVPLLLVVRLSLFVPATLGRRQMVSLNSMGIAYGSFWPLLAGLVVTAVPTVAVLALIGWATLTHRVASVAWIVTLVGLQLPLTLAFLGAAYRQLEYWTQHEAHP